jgi:hypothetical protein
MLRRSLERYVELVVSGGADRDVNERAGELRGVRQSSCAAIRESAVTAA